MKVLDIFSSIQGEGSNMGKPTVFIRLAGCNLKCEYCDTKEEMKKTPKEMDISEIIDKVVLSKAENVCITGGEPLLQREDLIDLISGLVYYCKNVEVETNGTIPLLCLYYPNLRYIMDIKTPSSGNDIDYEVVIDNIKRHLNVDDDIVFVIKNKEDFDFALDMLKNLKLSGFFESQVYFSVCIEEDIKTTDLSYLAKWVMENIQLQPLLRDVKVQVQLHKILGMR